MMDVRKHNAVMVRAIMALQEGETQGLVEVTAKGTTSFKVPSPGEVAQKYGGPVDEETAIQRFMAGVALSVAQSIMASSKAFGEKEIKAYLKMRRAFHPEFVSAAIEFANYIEDTPQKSVARDVRRLAMMGPAKQKQIFQILPRIAVKLKSLKIQDIDDVYTRRAFRPLFALARVTDEEPEEWGYSSRMETLVDLFKQIVKFEGVPTKLKTFFRRMMKIAGKTMSLEYRPVTFGDVAEPGEWLSLSPEQKVEVQTRAIEIRGQEKDILDIDDIDERRRALKQLSDERIKLQQEVGINFSTIERGPRESVEEAIKKERRMNRDAITDYVIDKWVKGQKQLRIDYPKHERAGKREQNKVFTLLNKAKTLSTAKLIVQEAVEKGLWGKGALEDFEIQAGRTKGNLAVQENIPLAPLDWKPMDEETFRDKHDVGTVKFDPEYTKKEKQEILGRVSRALSDLETVYGSKVAGRHARKLKMVFRKGSGTSGGALASYFGWDNRNRWEPRVEFGQDFDNLLAHELSHFFDDLIAHEVDRKSKDPIFQQSYGDIAKGPGDIFGSTGVTLSHSAEAFGSTELGDTLKHGKSAGKRTWQAKVKEDVPELAEWVKAVNESPDHERWKDLVPGAYDMVIERAITDVLGDVSWEEKEEIRKIERKSQLPPGVNERAEELYREFGDSRALNYKHTAVEVWARMCEQYVYTKLSRDGIANPWLTQMSYDTSTPGHEVFMEQGHFDAVMVPIYDRLFARLRKKGMIGEGVAFISLSWLLQEALS